MPDIINPSTGTKLTGIDEAEPKILVNRARCRKCGDFLESLSVHDFRRCSCGAIAIDGGLVYLRRCAKDLDDIEELSEVVKV